MEKTIEVGGVRFPAKSTAASFISYKANFHRDAMRDLMGLAKGLPKNAASDEQMIEFLAGNESFDMEVFTRFLWVFAKAANKEIPPFEDWLDSFDASPMDFLQETFPQVAELLFSNMQTGVKPKNQHAAAAGK